MHHKCIKIESPALSLVVPSWLTIRMLVIHINRLKQGEIGDSFNLECLPSDGCLPSVSDVVSASYIT